MKKRNHFGISLEKCSMCIVYGKNKAEGIGALTNEKLSLDFFFVTDFPEISGDLPGASEL